MSRFASNIYVALDAESDEEAQDRIRKLVKGCERAAKEHGIDVLPHASPPVPQRSRERSVAATDTEPETLFDEQESA